jgi:hypothetical protein
MIVTLGASFSPGALSIASRVFWTDQAGEPAIVRRYYRTMAALVVLLVITLMGFGLWLSAGR